MTAFFRGFEFDMKLSLTTLGFIITVVGGTFGYVLRTEAKFADVANNQGRIEGKLDMILEDRKDLLRHYQNGTMPTPALINQKTACGN